MARTSSDQGLLSLLTEYMHLYPKISVNRLSTRTGAAQLFLCKLLAHQHNTNRREYFSTEIDYTVDCLSANIYPVYCLKHGVRSLGARLRSLQSADGKPKEKYKQRTRMLSLLDTIQKFSHVNSRNLDDMIFRRPLAHRHSMSTKSK